MFFQNYSLYFLIHCKSSLFHILPYSLDCKSIELQIFSILFTLSIKKNYKQNYKQKKKKSSLFSLLSRCLNPSFRSRNNSPYKSLVLLQDLIVNPPIYKSVSLNCCFVKRRFFLLTTISFFILRFQN